MNEGDFHVGLTEASGGAIDLPTDEVIGLDFLKFMIDTESMEGLIAHLQQLSVNFFWTKAYSTHNL